MQIYEFIILWLCFLYVNILVFMIIQHFEQNLHDYCSKDVPGEQAGMMTLTLRKWQALQRKQEESANGLKHRTIAAKVIKVRGMNLADDFLRSTDIVKNCFFVPVQDAEVCKYSCSHSFSRSIMQKLKILSATFSHFKLSFFCIKAAW